MTVAVALIRGINVGGKNMLPMEVLRALCEGAGLRDARTLIQSGNVVFRCADRSVAGCAGKLEGAIERKCGFRPSVVVRTLAELRGVCAARVFKDHDSLEPNRLLAMFLATEPGASAKKAIAAITASGAYAERVAVLGREVFLYFPNGIAGARLPMSAVEKAIGTPGTCRNWTTITKLLAMGEELDAEG